MKMEFIFDDERLKREGITKLQCLQKIRTYFDSFENNSIVETSEGIFEGSTENYTAFGSALSFYKIPWFMNVIKEWYWTMEAYGQYEREDILETMKKVFS